MSVNYLVLLAWVVLLTLAVLITIAAIPAVWSFAMFVVSGWAITLLTQERR